MITLRRAEERRHDRRRNQEVWLTFYPQDKVKVLPDGFKALEILDESRLSPGASVTRHAHRDVEIVTYAREGSLGYEDSTGRSGVICAGEFQRTSARRGNHRRESNASSTDWAHVFQVGLRSASAGLAPDQEQKRFSAAERRGGLCIVASPDARRGSLRIHQDAQMFSAILDPGQHVVHELSRGRSAWLHLVQGQVTLGDLVLATGDGAGVTAERAVSLTARDESEILLLDLDEGSPRSLDDGGVP